MSRPTPETDAFSIQIKTICGQKKWVPVDFARKLERERDEWAAMCGRYKQERDTLMQKLDAWQEIAEHLHHLVQHPAYGVEQAIRRMDILAAYKHLNDGR